MRFEWDEAKNLSNQRKHGLSFEKASAVFLDPLCVTVQERVENGELRWRTTGNVEDLIIVTVAHTVREENAEGRRVDVFRIISARRAIRKEKRRYEDENR
ncbi:MAG TPA: BrnT family toxin [Candidatus Sulfotelmatobacter sp.]